ncbi:T9SS type A sorting domain-containing protein [Bacteroidales bacterium AH-315-I05]|nr:T9SS type A sorting domain-containing protein [Bacteroidales bacterium AH-315-I05]
MRFFKFIMLLLLLMPTATVIAQINYSRWDSIPIIENSDTLSLAWAGGLNSPQFSEIDLNDDGIKDLFVFDRNGNVIKTFINKGTANVVDYEYAPEYRSTFPDSIFNFALLHDYNCDGREDIFTYIPGGIAVYRNDYTLQSGLKFTLVSPMLMSDYGTGNLNLFVSGINVPAISDVDNDGDLDVLSYNVASFTVQYHQNQSMDMYGHCDSLTFVVADACWGNFQENSSSNSVTLGISCKGANGSPGNGNETANGGTSMLAIDMDGDGDKEYIQGQINFKNLVEATNDGDSITANMTGQDVSFPSNTTPVYMTYPASYYLDMNNDGKKDLVVGCNTSNSSENFKSVWYYKNIGQNDSTVLNFTTKSFLQEEMLEVGDGANPVFFDYNADGLLDLIVGNDGYFSLTGLAEGKLALFENTGTVGYPVFELITRNYVDVFSLGLNNLYPTFGDIDGDGDDDMLIGDYNGKLFLFDNTAGAGNPVSFMLIQSSYMGVDVGQNAAPQLIDVNRDGLLDIIIGERSGNLNYFQNNGTASNASFNATPDNNFFGELDMMLTCCTGYSSPFMVENNVGKYALWVGSERGTIYYYTNIEGNLNGAFTLADSINTYSLRASVSANDLNNDGKTELIYGEYGGGTGILKIQIAGSISELLNEYEVEVFPNPTKGNVELRIKNDALTGYGSTSFNVTIYNVLGENIYMNHEIQNTKHKTIDIDLSNQPNGIYFLRISLNSAGIAKKIVKL